MKTVGVDRMGLKLGLLQRGSTYRLKLYKHKALRKICKISEPNVAKELGWRRKVPQEGYDVPSPNIVAVIKPRNMRWAGDVEGMHTELLWESLNENEHLENIVVHGKTTKNIRFYKIWQIIRLSIWILSHNFSSQPNYQLMTGNNGMDL